MNGVSMEVLNGRDIRTQYIEKLLVRDLVIISLRANFPGENKDNEMTRLVISEIDHLIRKQFEIVEDYFLNQGEGNVYLYVLNCTDGFLIKQKMIEIENNHKFGRLVDIDVYFKDLKSISRSMLNEPRRRCFLCQLDAFYCIRNKSHSNDEIIQYINEVVYGKSFS
ncbi:MAG: holo-ACP synthase CitX [Haloplasmataceae bacterium]|jgi:holo-ACP synthase CitX|nr:holo-ACP synthase CitX [Haloplasmataceae bacterium]